MAVRRLDNVIRNDIRFALLRHRFEPTIKDIKKRHCELAMKFYEDIFKDDIKAMKRIPDGWLPKHDYISFTISGQRDLFYFNGRNCFSNSDHVILGINNKIPEIRQSQLFPDSFNPKNYPISHPLAIERAKLIQEKDTLDEQVRDAAAYAKTVMASVTTVSRLLEVWPDVAPFVPKLEEVRVANLPSIPIEKLNEMFKLPPEKAPRKKAA